MKKCIILLVLLFILFGCNNSFETIPELNSNKLSSRSVGEITGIHYQTLTTTKEIILLKFNSFPNTSNYRITYEYLYNDQLETMVLDRRATTSTIETTAIRLKSTLVSIEAFDSNNNLIAIYSRNTDPRDEDNGDEFIEGKIMNVRFEPHESPNAMIKYLRFDPYPGTGKYRVRYIYYYDGKLLEREAEIAATDNPSLIVYKNASIISLEAISYGRVIATR